jgi:hypothetical protein
MGQNGLDQTRMKIIFKSLVVASLFAGGAILSISQADAGGSLTAPTRTISTAPESVTMDGLSISSKTRRKKLPLGVWGGEHISMEVTDRRATIEYDCAHGTINERIMLDRRGRFDVSGMQIPEHGGPVTRDEQASGYPARFAGQVTGKKMMLTVTNVATREIIGTFTLVKGVEAILRKCR